MGLKGFPESSKFRHLFVPGLFQLRRSMTLKTISLSVWKKGGERSKWLRIGQVTAHKTSFWWGAATQLGQPAFGGFSDILFGFVVNLS